MAAAWISSRKIVPTLASAVMRRWETTRTVLVSTQERLVHHCINGRRWAAVEKRNYFIPHPRRYGTSLFSAMGMEKLGRATGDYNYDLAVDKAIQHYHKHIKMELGDGQNTMIYPLEGATEYLSGVNLFHILLKTTGGQKYISICLAPDVDPSTKLDDGALKLMFFRKLDDNNNNLSLLPFRKVVGEIRWPVCPRNDPLISAAARFALAQHNKDEKLAHLIRATCQMVSECEIFRMTFKGEFSDISSLYDAIVLVPRKNPEKMDLVVIKESDGWGMYGRLRLYHGSRLIVPRLYPVQRYKYESDSEPKFRSPSDGEYTYQYEDDGCVADDPRVTAAARFALALYNEMDRVRLGDKKDEVRRVVEASRRTYMGDEILNMIFDGELDGSWSYHAIVLVPVNDPENMRLAYCGRDYDDPDPYGNDYESDARWGTDPVDELADADDDGSDDPRVVEAARLALATHNKKDKLVRVVKATKRIDSKCKTYTMRFVGEDHPRRTYVAIVSDLGEDPEGMRVEYVSY